jgi:ABC-type transport system substrate-binding protein
MARRVASAAFIGRRGELRALRAALSRAADGDPAVVRAADIGNEIDRRLWAQLPSIPLYPLPGFLAWRQDLVNVEHNTTTEGPFWNVGTWGFATS